MGTDRDKPRVRQYLLGELAEEQCAALEEEYFAQQDTFDRVWAAEDALIDDYLSDQLTAPERDRFERHYLATPGHRQRLAIARELLAASSALIAPPVTRVWTGWWAAAAIVVLAIAGVWMLRGRPVPTTATNAPPSPVVEQPPASQPPKPSQVPVAPKVMALSISPSTMRGSDDAPTLVLAAGTELVALRLEGDTDHRPFGRGRAVVRTVAGDEKWRGPAVSDRDGPASVARIEMPAGTLAPDDYVIELFGTDSNGREVERDRYFMRVRRP